MRVEGRQTSGGFKSLRKKCLGRSAFPQRLEAAFDSATVTARVEEVAEKVEAVPFPSLLMRPVLETTISRQSFRSQVSEPFDAMLAQYSVNS